MKMAWLILMITAVTDGAIASGGAFGALLAQSTATVWTWGLIAACLLPGVMVFLRTIQQALKATPTSSAELRGIEVATITKTPGQTVVTAPADQIDAQVTRSAQNVRPKEEPRK